MEALDFFDPNIRLRVAKELAQYCIEQQTTLPELEQLVSSKDSFARFYAARALWKLTGQTERVVPSLVAGLSDHTTYYHNAEIRQLAAETLGEMGAKARPAIPALVASLADVQEKVRISATNALKQIDPEGAAAAAVK